MNLAVKSVSDPTKAGCVGPMCSGLGARLQNSLVHQHHLEIMGLLVSPPGTPVRFSLALASIATLSRLLMCGVGLILVMLAEGCCVSLFQDIGALF